MNHVSFLIKFDMFGDTIKFQISIGMIVNMTTSQIIGEIYVAGAIYNLLYIYI